MTSLEERDVNGNQQIDQIRLNHPQDGSTSCFNLAQDNLAKYNLVKPSLV
jgi:hypothetical protein